MMADKKSKAFTLIELLVVIAIIALLMSVLMPALAAARSQGQSLVGKSNLRQLAIANCLYANENNDAYVPAASDLWDNNGLNRWHGTREDTDEPFDPLKGPLAGYLGDGTVKQCPNRINFDEGFEEGCGGYGYNLTYLGSRLWQSGISTLAEWKKAHAMTTHSTEVRKPSETLMFADAAIASYNSRLIEYSFAEAPFSVMNGKPETRFYMSPSIHFRHRQQANIVWSDGHVDAKRMTKFEKKNVYGVSSAQMGLGWFGPIDNSFFDLK